jgi:hypothetical protein
LIVNDSSYQLAAGFWLVAGSNYTGGSSLQTTWGNTTNRRARGQTNLTTSGNYLQITGIQLEVGTVATDFENLPFDVSQNRCWRYFVKISADNGDMLGLLGLVSSTTTSALTLTNLPTIMRTIPTLVTSGSALDYSWAEFGIAVHNCDQLPTLTAITSPFYVSLLTSWTTPPPLTAGNLGQLRS